MKTKKIKKQVSKMDILNTGTLFVSEIWEGKSVKMEMSTVKSARGWLSCHVSAYLKEICGTNPMGVDSLPKDMMDEFDVTHCGWWEHEAPKNKWMEAAVRKMEEEYSQVEKLCKDVERFIRRHWKGYRMEELVVLHLPLEWRMRREKYGCESLLVMCSGDFPSFFELLNGYFYDKKVIEGWEKLCKKHNVIFELCTGWYGAFYKR